MKPENIWQPLLRQSSGETFRQEMVAGVPEPGRRYLLHAMQPGTPLTNSVELDMTGRFRGSPKAKWMPLRASQVLALPGGFVWKASIGGIVRITGSDRYFQGEGALDWRLWGLVPVMRASGPDITRSARGRLAVEAAVWLPAVLLPCNGAEWEPVDDSTAKVILTADGEAFEILFSIAPNGALEKVRLNRWGNHLTPGGAFRPIPFGATVSEEQTLAGCTVPTRIAAGWRPGTDDYFEFFQVKLTRVHYR